jgi:hypothetical protein
MFKLREIEKKSKIEYLNDSSANIEKLDPINESLLELQSLIGLAQLKADLQKNTTLSESSK